MNMRKIKIFFWKIGLLPENQCPLCKKGLIQHYGEEEYEMVWSCYNEECEFEK
jgi:hypothetical protein